MARTDQPTTPALSLPEAQGRPLPGASTPGSTFPFSTSPAGTQPLSPSEQPSDAAGERQAKPLFELGEKTTRDGKHTEAEYQAYLVTGPNGPIWWPWWVAEEYLWRKTRQEMLRTALIALAAKGAFNTGKRADAPLKKAPVDRESFQNWVHGKSQKARAERDAARDLSRVVKDLSSQLQQLTAAMSVRK